MRAKDAPLLIHKIQDIKIRTLVFIRSLYDHYYGFYALKTTLYMHVEGTSRALPATSLAILINSSFILKNK